MTDKILADFEAFHRDNPQVYDLFDRFARDLIRAGRKGSAKLIFERIRWELIFETTDELPKLNNNYTALYAREWERQNPDYPGFFAKRQRRAHTINSTEFAEAA